MATNTLVWVDPDEFNTLLDAVEDLLKNWGLHDGVCAPEDIDNPDSWCVLHKENFNRRSSTAKEALKAFRPDFTPCNPEQLVVE